MKTVNNISGTHTLIALGAIAIFAAVVFKAQLQKQHITALKEVLRS